MKKSFDIVDIEHVGEGALPGIELKFILNFPGVA
jgi:hypothetical protein